MKHMKIFGVVILVLFLFLLAACGQKGNGSQSASNPTAQVSPAAGTAANDSSLSATATIDVEALISERLQNHHSIDRIFSATHTREEWNATLDRMNSRGAGISDSEKQIIIDYLMARNK